MRGRLNSAVTGLITMNVIGLFFVLFIAYAAGEHSGGLSLLDGLSAPSRTPVLILFAAVANLGSLLDPKLSVPEN